MIRVLCLLCLIMAGCQTAHPDYDLDSTPEHAGESYQGVE